jgi:hypothetical protein
MSKQRIAFEASNAMDTARSYHAAAHLLEQHAAQTIAHLNVPGIPLTLERVNQIGGEKAVPVVLHALALEIVLKVRLHLAKVPFKQFGRKHNHAELFAMLPEKEKQVLARRYAERRNHMFRSPILLEALQWSGDAFIKWRYRYEWSSVDASVGEMLLAYDILQEGL